VIPHIVVPTEGSAADSFLIGLRLEVATAHCLRIGTIDRGLSQEVCTTVAEVSWNDFRSEERLVAERLRARATLALAGAETSPEDPISLSVRSPIYWSVRPKSPGTLRGWISIESETVQNLDQKAEVEMTTDAKTAFTIRIHKETLTVPYTLSVIGGILGTLLASVPAWLAWYDKRKGDQSKASPVILLK